MVLRETFQSSHRSFLSGLVQRTLAVCLWPSFDSWLSHMTKALAAQGREVPKYGLLNSPSRLGYTVFSVLSIVAEAHQSVETNA